MARDHAKHPRVLAVIATGSVARNRCSGDSDLDLIVITNEAGRRARIDSTRLQGIPVVTERVTIQRAASIARGGKRDVKGLREASRLGLGLPLYDPQGLAENFRRQANALVPDLAQVASTLGPVVRTLATLQGASQPDAQRWETLRSIFDSLAFITLLFHPVRYHKPKWVIADLEETGHRNLKRSLLEAYRIRPRSRAAAVETLDLAQAFLERTAAVLHLPTLPKTLALGFTRKYAQWSYVCRTWADAGSLLRDGRPAEAQYTGKFAARMAVTLCLAELPAEASVWSPQETLDYLGDRALSKTYAALFPARPLPATTADRLLASARTMARRCLKILRETYPETA